MGQSFRLACPFRQESGGLKTPGYSKTVLRTGLHWSAKIYAGGKGMQVAAEVWCGARDLCGGSCR